MKKILLMLCLIAAPSFATVVKWEFVRVVDGDTVSFISTKSPVELQKVSVRILGIDTPESTYLAKCDKEKEAGILAKEFLKSHIGDGKGMVVDVKDWDKYGGRVLGNIYIKKKSVAETMIEKGHARKYDGKKKSDWCN